MRLIIILIYYKILPGVIWQDGIHAGPARKFARQALQEFGTGKTILENKVLQEMGFISNILKKNLDAPFTLKPTLKKAISNILHSVAFGKRLVNKQKQPFASV